jgi:hypothetical protein
MPPWKTITLWNRNPHPLPAICSGDPETTPRVTSSPCFGTGDPSAVGAIRKWLGKDPNPEWEGTQQANETIAHLETKTSAL